MLLKLFQVSYEVVILQKLGFLLLCGSFNDDIGYKGCYERQNGGGFFSTLSKICYLLSVPVSPLIFLLHHHHLLYLQCMKLERLMRYVLIYN